MRKILLISTFVVHALVGFGQENNAMEVFEELLDAFNEHNVERMTDLVSDDVVYFYVMKDSLITEIQGKEQFRSAMNNYFTEISSVKSRIIDSFQTGNLISFEEEVSWGEEDDKKSSRSLGVYEIKDGLITRSWYFIP